MHNQRRHTKLPCTKHTWASCHCSLIGLTVRSRWDALNGQLSQTEPSLNLSELTLLCASAIPPQECAGQVQKTLFNSLPCRCPKTANESCIAWAHSKGYDFKNGHCRSLALTKPGAAGRCHQGSTCHPAGLSACRTRAWLPGPWG